MYIPDASFTWHKNIFSSQEQEPDATEWRSSNLTFHYGPSTYLWVTTTVKNKPVVLTYTWSTKYRPSFLLELSHEVGVLLLE